MSLISIPLSLKSPRAGCVNILNFIQSFVLMLCLNSVLASHAYFVCLFVFFLETEAKTLSRIPISEFPRVPNRNEICQFDYIYYSQYILGVASIFTRRNNRQANSKESNINLISAEIFQMQRLHCVLHREKKKSLFFFFPFYLMECYHFHTSSQSSKPDMNKVEKICQDAAVVTFSIRARHLIEL